MDCSFDLRWADSISSQKQNLGKLHDQVLWSTLGQDLFEVSPKYFTLSVLKTKALYIKQWRREGSESGK